MPLARSILGLLAAMLITAAQAQNAPPFPSTNVEPFAEDTTPIEDCLAPFDSLHLDAKAKGELVKTLDQSTMVQSGRCRLIANYETAQLRLLHFVRANQERCHIRREYRQAVLVALEAAKKLRTETCRVRLAS